MATRKYEVWLAIIVLGSFLCVEARIIQGPVNHTVPIGAIVNFKCLAEGQDVIWIINNTSIDCQSTMRNFEEKGFMCTRRFDNSIYNLTMTVNAFPGNNNTKITCRIIYGHSSATLTVIGPPSPPEPQLLVLSATAIQIFWLPPFSWADYPIVNYTVQICNRATGDVINSTVYVKSTETLSRTVTFIYTTPHGRVMQNCEELVFSVSAANSIGWSSPAVVTGGFPIAPRLDATSIETTVAFQFDDSLLLILSIQLPDICSFQLSYSITIQQIHPSDSGAREENNIIVIGPKTVMDRTIVYEVVKSSLVVDAVYSVLVEFDTLAGNVSSNTTFGLNSTYPRQCSYPETYSRPTSYFTDVIATTGAGISLVEQIAVGVSVGLCIIITSAITLVLLVVCGFMYRRRTSDERSIRKACDGMMPNPIYEGPLYESVETACAPSQRSEEDNKESSGTTMIITHL